MNYEAYPFRYKEDNNHFQFQSVGKRGTFEKVIAITLIEDDIYNLALLDMDPVTQGYNDKSVTDNGDMPKILATVMAVIIDFLNQYPHRKIYLIGNTASRTRLYQIAINKILDQIENDPIVLGYHNSQWIPFEPNRNFESFLIIRNFLD